MRTACALGLLVLVVLAQGYHSSTRGWLTDREPGPGERRVWFCEHQPCERYNPFPEDQTCRDHRGSPFTLRGLEREE